MAEIETPQAEPSSPKKPKAEPAAALTQTAAALEQASAASSGLSGQLIYVGPTIKIGGWMLSHSGGFKSGLPLAVDQVCAEDPELKRLFVPPAELALARVELRDAASPLAVASRSVFQRYRAQKS
jgi:hypothetical protein